MRSGMLRQAGVSKGFSHGMLFVVPRQVLDRILVPGDSGRPVDRGRPARGVGDDLADFLVEIGRVRLVPRSEVEDLARTPVVGRAAPENFAALEPAHEA